MGAELFELGVGVDGGDESVGYVVGTLQVNDDPSANIPEIDETKKKRRNITQRFTSIDSKRLITNDL